MHQTAQFEMMMPWMMQMCQAWQEQQEWEMQQQQEAHQAAGGQKEDDFPPMGIAVTSRYASAAASRRGHGFAGPHSRPDGGSRGSTSPRDV